MSDEKVKYQIDLDTKDAIQGAIQLKNKISELGESKSLESLLAGFTELAGPIAVAGVAVFAFKKALDFSVEGENLVRVEEAFKSVAESAGVSSENILKGIEKATRGTLDQTDAIKLATRGIVTLGDAADKIPQLFELANKAGQKFGIDTVQAYEAINNAVAFGATRQLRSIGIKLDAQQAEIKYALSIGKTTQLLTEQDKIQARINALLDIGNKKFGDNAKTLTPLQDTMARFNVALHDMSEGLQKLVYSKFGDFFIGLFESMSNGINILQNTKLGFKDLVAIMISPGVGLSNAMLKVKESMEDLSRLSLQQLKDKSSEAENKISSLTAQLETLTKLKESTTDQGLIGSLNRDIDKAKEKIKEAQEESKKLYGLISNKMTDDGGNQEAYTKVKNKPEEINPAEQQRQLEAKNKFEAELLNIKQSRVTSELDIETNKENYLKILTEQRLLTEQEYNNKIAQIKDRANKADGLSAQQASLEIQQIEEEKFNKLKDLQNKADDSSNKSYQNKIAQAKSLADGISANAALDAATMNKQLKDGSFVYGQLKIASSTFFSSLGKGSQAAAAAMGQALFGFLGSYVMFKGQALAAEGTAMIASYQPQGSVLIGEGAALQALGGVIQGLAGSFGGGGGSSGGGGGGGGSSSAPVFNSQNPGLDPQQQQKKTVTIQVQGNYFETDQTKRALLDMIRQETDATDYKYIQIPVR